MKCFYITTTLVTYSIWVSHEKKYIFSEQYVHWNSLQLLKQYGSKRLFQIVVQFISLSCNLTSHLGNILWPNTTNTNQNYNSQYIPVQRQFSLKMLVNWRLVLSRDCSWVYLRESDISHETLYSLFGERKVWFCWYYILLWSIDCYCTYTREREREKEREREREREKERER